MVYICLYCFMNPGLAWQSPKIQASTPPHLPGHPLPSGATPALLASKQRPSCRSPPEGRKRRPGSATARWGSWRWRSAAAPHNLPTAAPDIDWLDFCSKDTAISMENRWIPDVSGEDFPLNSSIDKWQGDFWGVCLFSGRNRWGKQCFFVHNIDLQSPFQVPRSSGSTCQISGLISGLDFFFARTVATKKNSHLE